MKSTVNFLECLEIKETKSSADHSTDNPMSKGSRVTLQTLPMFNYIQGSTITINSDPRADPSPMINDP